MYGQARICMFSNSISKRFSVSFVQMLRMNTLNGIITTTQTGKVQGVIQKGLKHDKFYAFKGIPYAKPPIGQLRFRDPEPAEPWTSIKKAAFYGSSCAQFDPFINQVKGGDDCLYLNVFTKDMKFRTGRPVIVWNHPGIFLHGSGDDYGPEYLMSKDVVLVTLNYRLGVFGFLNMDIEEASGNQGLKDQLMALKWVRDNIANFGGDPDNVTIAGLSVGSASAHHLAISPLAKGLFHKAILLSGTALNPWTFLPNPNPRVNQLCESLGHSTNDSKSIIDFLRAVDAQQLALAQERLQFNEYKSRFVAPFGPSIDSKSRTPLILTHPEIAAAEGIQVPLMIGQTSREGLFYITEIKKVIEILDKDFDKFLHPGVITTIKKLYNLTTKDLKHIYFKNVKSKKDSLKILCDLLGDLYIVEGIHRTLRIQMEKNSSPTYFYQFSYDKQKPRMKETTGNIRISGASHTAELQYLFKEKYSNGVVKNISGDSEGYRLRERMIELLVNFATTGNPTPETSNLIPVYWQPVNNKTEFHYLDISDELRMDTMLSLEQRFIDARLKIKKGGPCANE